MNPDKFSRIATDQTPHHNETTHIARNCKRSKLQEYEINEGGPWRKACDTRTSEMVHLKTVRTEDMHNEKGRNAS